MRKKKQSFELTFEQTEMLGKFGGASFDYPKLSFEKVARKLLRENFGLAAVPRPVP